MIRHLNPLNFKTFGTIFSERTPDSASVPSNMNAVILDAHQQDVTVYRAQADTLLFSRTNTSILSVSCDGKDFQHYYLDKQVCINAGILFFISPFEKDSTSVELQATILPEKTDLAPLTNDFRPPHQLQITELYTFFYHEKERGFVFSGETHSMFELTYVDQGTLHSVVDGQDTILQQGELMIYGPKQWHMQYADVDVAPRYVTITFDLDIKEPQLLLNRKFEIPQRSASLLQQLMREQEYMDAFSPDLIIALLTQLLISLIRNSDSPATRLKASNSIHSENEIIRRAQQYVGSHIREKLSVPLVAKMVDVSPSYLTALFHKNLQISPGEYIRRIKLQESKQMIRENSMNFTEIAATLQYSTVHHFSRQFKEKFGITPTEYAKSVRSF